MEALGGLRGVDAQADPLDCLRGMDAQADPLDCLPPAAGTDLGRAGRAVATDDPLDSLGLCLHGSRRYVRVLSKGRRSSLQPAAHAPQAAGGVQAPQRAGSGRRAGAEQPAAPARQTQAIKVKIKAVMGGVPG